MPINVNCGRDMMDKIVIKMAEKTKGMSEQIIKCIY